MNMLSVVKNLCVSVYCGISNQCRNGFSLGKLNVNVNYPEKNAFAEALPLATKKVRPSRHQSKVPHLSKHINQKFVPASRVEAADTVKQTLFHQIHQQISKNNRLLSDIAVSPREQPYRPIYSTAKINCSQNEQKFQELTKLNDRLLKVSDFCNEEMVDVLHFVTEGCINLEKKLHDLCQATPFITDEVEMLENQMHIEVLLNVAKALHDLELKFQAMQRKNTLANTPTSSENEVNALIEEVEWLNEENQFLSKCKQNLPPNGAYDMEEMKGLLGLFGNERKELNQNVNEARQKLNKAKEFGKELTNHLLDYAELLKYNLQKLERLPSKPTITQRLNINTTKMSLATRQTKLEAVVKEEGVDSDNMRKAAHELALALTNLLKID